MNLIQNLSMVSLAEGVEDATQVAVLQSLGCDLAQGYFFSRPVMEDSILEGMAAARARAEPLQVDRSAWG